MRENIGLFRGKRKDNGEWVEGNLFENDNTQFPLFLIGYVVMSRNEYTGGLELNGFGLNEVDPDTIGECTGLKDKNGKLIFEGDVVRILGDQTSEDWKCVDYNALIAFLDGGFCALDGTIEEYGFRRYALARMDFDLEIIGNIHDNPELLKGGEGE